MPVFSRIRSLLIVLSLFFWIVFDPRWHDLLLSRWYLLKGIETTFVYSIMGGLLGLIAGGFLAAMRMVGGVLGVAATAVVAFSQAIPPLFIIVAFYLATPNILSVTPSPEAAGVIALGVIASGYYCEAIRAAVVGVDPLQAEAGRMSGLSRIAVFSRIVLPQALVACVPAIGAASIIVFKLSTLLYPIGITDFFRATVLVNNRVIEPLRCYVVIAAFYYVASDIIQIAISLISDRISTRSSGRNAESVKLKSFSSVG